MKVTKTEALVTTGVHIDLTRDEANHLFTILNYSGQLWECDRNLDAGQKKVVEKTSRELWCLLDNHKLEVLRQP